MSRTLTKPVQHVLPFIEAQRLVLEAARPLGIEKTLLSASVGRFTGEDIMAATTLPPFDNSAMDGYAVQSADTQDATPERPVILPLVGESAAGVPFTRTVQSGEAIKIMTGAPVPDGADTVVMLEQARQRGETVHFLGPAVRGTHIRHAGEDMQIGQVALRRGTCIAWQHVGLLASLGCARVQVYRSPTVAVLATGSELVSIDAALGPGQIRNSNSVLLTTRLRRERIPFQDLGIVQDNYEQLLDRLRAGLQADVLCISGGVSVGAYDLVQRALGELGFEKIFWRVKMKPGKPQLFGRAGSTYVFGLPGNPVSCAVGYVTLIRPFLRKILGDPSPVPAMSRARLTSAWHSRDEKTHLVTARVATEGSSWSVTPTSKQGSGMLSSLAESNAFIVAPEGVLELSAGAQVEVMPFA